MSFKLLTMLSLMSGSMPEGTIVEDKEEFGEDFQNFVDCKLIEAGEMKEGKWVPANAPAIEQPPVMSARMKELTDMNFADLKKIAEDFGIAVAPVGAKKSDLAAQVEAREIAKAADVPKE